MITELLRLFYSAPLKKTGKHLARLNIPDFMLASFDTTRYHTRRTSNAGIKARLIPETVKSGCGLSLRMAPEVTTDIAHFGKKAVTKSHWTLSAIDGVRQFITQESPLMKEDSDLSR